MFIRVNISLNLHEVMVKIAKNCDADSTFMWEKLTHLLITVFWKLFCSTESSFGEPDEPHSFGLVRPSASWLAAEIRSSGCVAERDHRSSCDVLCSHSPFETVWLLCSGLLRVCVCVCLGMLALNAISNPPVENMKSGSKFNVCLSLFCFFTGPDTILFIF